MIGPEARFARQHRLPGVGPQGLQRLALARIHVVGAGSVAGPALAYLARAGVGTLYLDDGGDVDWSDQGSWLYRDDQQGQPRLLAALDALGALAGGVELRPAATDTVATAALICPAGEAVARLAADRARQAGLPHVVALGDAAGGEVVSVPSGAPCFACASRPGARAQPRGAAASAVSSLAALELLLILTGLSPREQGRRLTLQDGLPSAAATARRPGCDCARY